jgi:molybdopterin molybdotransferase
VISLDEALQHVLAVDLRVPSETIPIEDALGRYLAAPLTAGLSQPPFDASAMDGYAVRADQVALGRPLRQIGTAQAGQRFTGMMSGSQCVRIFTGAPLPIGADAVVPQEEVIANGSEITFTREVEPGRFVRRRGSVYSDGEPLLPAGMQLTPARLSLAASANRPKVTVAGRPRVALLATGDELVSPGTSPGPDQIVSANSYGLAGLLASIHAEVFDLGIVRDDPTALRDVLSDVFAVGVHVLVTTGGASVGERDYVQDALRSLGVELDFWQIAMRPGKPLMFGRRDNTLVFGLPGNPVSALVTGSVVLMPALRNLLGAQDPLGPRLHLPLASGLPANGIRRHFLRATYEPTPAGTTVLPIGETDSGHLASLAGADALIVQHENDPGMESGDIVEVIPLG